MNHDKPKKTTKESLNQPVSFESAITEIPVPIEEVKPVPSKKMDDPVPPKKYVCKVKCWVSNRAKMYEVGDVTAFDEGEYVPSHFDLIE